MPTIVLIRDGDEAGEVEIAEREFLKYLEKVLTAFATSDKRKIQVYRFDPRFEKIVLLHLVKSE